MGETDTTPKTWQEKLSREVYSLRLRKAAVDRLILSAEFSSGRLSLDEQEDLREQQMHMDGYLAVLKRRARRAGV
jgi:hypothetical protein